MSFPKFIAILAVFLFGTIGIAAVMKGRTADKGKEKMTVVDTTTLELMLNLDEEDTTVAEEEEKTYPIATDEESEQPPQATLIGAAAESSQLVDRIDEFFNTRGPKFPFVETVSYKSRVDWQQGRPAWLSDYAGYYKTSRHFIARSLNKKPDYFKQDIANGDKFNVFKRDVDLSFYLVITTGDCKMQFYAYDATSNTRTLIKTYDVGLGRPSNSLSSGLLTPLGQFKLGERVAIYKPKTTGFFNGEKTEMIRIFGTRWIPFDVEGKEGSEAAEGLGIHGVPWVDQGVGVLVEDMGSLGKYQSDGCIRLSTKDMEELFAIVISKPATVELVRDLAEAHLPGIEKP